MARQFSVAVRNALADAYETAVGVSPTLEIRSGAQPATCATADSGTLLVSMALPADWLTAAASGAKALVGSWADPSADAAGTAAHFRIKQGATCHDQGNVTATGGGGDMTLDTVTIVATQPVSITAFTITASGA